jgi:hypothetical protein
MKNYQPMPAGRPMSPVCYYYVSEEADGQWTLNLDGFAIRVYPSKDRAFEDCRSLLNERCGPQRVQTPDGAMVRSQATVLSLPKLAVLGHSAA